MRAGVNLMLKLARSHEASQAHLVNVCLIFGRRACVPNSRKGSDRQGVSSDT